MRKYLILIANVCFGLALFSFSTVQAESSQEESRGRVSSISVHGFSELDKLFANNKAGALSVKPTTLNSPVKLKLKIPGIGRLESKLLKQKFFNISSNNSVFLQGDSSLLSGSDSSENASFATIIRNKKGDKLLRLFVVGGARKLHGNSKKRLMEVRALLGSQNGNYSLEKITLHRSKRSESNKLGCIDGHNHGASLSHSQRSERLIKAEVKIAKLLVEADNEYVGKLSGTMSSELATIVNGVDTIYQRDLGLSFDTTFPSQTTAYTAPIQYDENYALMLHNEMKIAKPAETRGADIHFLFTGKTPVGDDLANLAGVVPQIGAVCKTPANSIGLTIRIDTATDIVVTAHEIGHLYGAEHDNNFTDANNPNIMNSTVSDTITSFSSYSYSQIGTFVSENGSCLVTGEGSGGSGGGGGGGGGGGPTTLPATATIEAYKSGKRFVVEVYDSETDEVYSSYAVSVMYSKKSKGTYQVIKELTLNEEGLAAFKPRKKGFYYFQVGDRVSKKIRLK